MEGIGRRAAGSMGERVGGRRKGSVPVGEAWLVEGATVCGRADIRTAV